MATEKTGVESDPLNKAMTRPSMRWGMTYTAAIFVAAVSGIVYTLTKSILIGGALLAVLGVICREVCAYDVHFFDISWIRFQHFRRNPTRKHWKSKHYEPY